jgi:hypothetical protein
VSVLSLILAAAQAAAPSPASAPAWQGWSPAVFTRAQSEKRLFVTVPEVASRPQTGGVLLADHELSADPLHVTVVGARGDEVAQALLLEARRHPDGGKRVELWDPADGPLPHSNVVYPRLARPAAFLCAAGRCSPPAFDAGALRALMSRMSRAVIRQGTSGAPRAGVAFP